MGAPVIAPYGQPQSDLDELAALLRDELDPADRTLGVLAVLDVVATSTAGPDAALVAAAVEVVDEQARTAFDLATTTHAARQSETPSVAATRLDRALAASTIPAGPERPPEPGADEATWFAADAWIAREAASLADHCGFLLDELDLALTHLERVPASDRSALAEQATQALDMLAHARELWHALA